MNKRILLLSGPDRLKGFAEIINELLSDKLSGKKSIVFISGSPNDHDKTMARVYGNDSFIGYAKMLNRCNIKLSTVTVIDYLNCKSINKKIIQDADIIFLMGGDPFLQIKLIKDNNFDESILKQKAFIIGVSAGSMNMAKRVCYIDESKNEKIIDYEGLGLTDLTIYPHFDETNEEFVKEVKTVSSITPLVALPNDSAIFIEGNTIKYLNNYYIFNGKE